MKIHLSSQRNQALTRIDVLVIIGTAASIFLIILLFIYVSVPIVQEHECRNNLTQIAVATRDWEGDNYNVYPMQLSVTNGGAMEAVAAGNAAACFQVMSNELRETKYLICPADAGRIFTTNFASLNNSNVSYFADLDGDESHPATIFTGDANFAIGGIPAKSGLLMLSSNAPVSWTQARHHYRGNIMYADGSYSYLSTSGLQKALVQTGVATNRLAIP